MSFECEVAGGVTKLKENSYIFIYHCLNDHGYQIGMSTASHPLGPWTPPPLKPTVAITPGAWDGTTVACFNILADPEKPGQWLGFYAASGESSPDYPWPIGLGVARAASPLGPWHKSPHNPVIAGNATHDPKHCFKGDTRCSGIYLGSVLYGPHTNNQYWAYLAGPLNQNDEGAMALWTSDKPEGPWKFHSYILDGGLKSKTWDSGRYSESRVLYQDGLFHIFPTASAAGGPNVPSSQTNKNVEQIGWAFSQDGIYFTEYTHNPVGPQNGTTPLTSAMAEGHAIMEGEKVYVYHTIRWTTGGTSGYAPAGRNNEDLGVEIFTSSRDFATIDVPLITPAWNLSLAPGANSICHYDKSNSGRDCAILKTVMVSSDPTADDIKPHISFRLQGGCNANAGPISASVVVKAYSRDGNIGKVLQTLPLSGTCEPRSRKYVGTTKAITAD